MSHAGGRVSAHLWLHNTTSSSASGIRPWCPGLTSHSGVALPSSAITCAPARIELLDPGASVDILVTAAIGDEAPAGTYHGLVLADGLPEVVFPLRIRVQPATECFMTTTSEPTSGLARYGTLVAEDLQRRFDDAGTEPYLAAPMRDYPDRGGKVLRPSMCLASCEAFGGRLDDALPSAVAIELLHNAFLVHDDIEDASLLRRGEPTLHRRFGTPLALNAGDGLALQAMATLRENIDLLGPRLADRIMVEFDFMSQQTVAGQALELGWCRDNRVDLTPDDYLDLIMKKTCWYTTVLPLRVGALVGSHGSAPLHPMIEFGFHLGAAFQIRDDMLNLVGDPDIYGKEALGDLLEGKRTLMLIHLLASADPADRVWLVAYLGRPLSERSHDDVARRARSHAGLREHRIRQRVRHGRGALRPVFHGCCLRRPRRHAGTPLHRPVGAIHDCARILNNRVLRRHGTCGVSWDKMQFDETAERDDEGHRRGSRRRRTPALFRSGGHRDRFDRRSEYRALLRTSSRP